MNVFQILIVLKVVFFVDANNEADDQPDYGNAQLRQMIDETVLIDNLENPDFEDPADRFLSKDTERSLNRHHRKHEKHGKRKEEAREKHRKRLLKKLIDTVNKNAFHLKPKLNFMKSGGIFSKEEGINQSQLVTNTEQEYNWDLFAYDHRMWIGIGLGSILSTLTILLAMLVYNYVKHRRKKQYCVDLNDLSLCSFGDIKRKDPVYVRLSDLHDPRAASLRGQYVVSVNQSNNFSVCTDESSSEEEIFDISDVRLKSPKKSMSKISMTSTPIKGSAVTLTRTGHNNSMQRGASLPVVASPLASPVIKTDNVEDVD